MNNGLPNLPQGWSWHACGTSLQGQPDWQGFVECYDNCASHRGLWIGPPSEVAFNKVKSDVLTGPDSKRQAQEWLAKCVGCSGRGLAGLGSGVNEGSCTPRL